MPEDRGLTKFLPVQGQFALPDGLQAVCKRLIRYLSRENLPLQCGIGRLYHHLRVIHGELRGHCRHCLTGKCVYHLLRQGLELGGVAQQSLGWYGATILRCLRLEGLTHDKLIHTLVNEHLIFYIDYMIISIICTSLV